MKIAVQIAIAW